MQIWVIKKKKYAQKGTQFPEYVPRKKIQFCNNSRNENVKNGCFLNKMSLGF